MRIMRKEWIQENGKNKRIETICKNICNFKYITLDDSEISETEMKNITNKLEDMGLNISITFNKVEEISPEMSGKFSILKRGI